MNESNLRSLESVLRWSKDTGKKLRFFGHAMVILAEALVAEVGDDIVALKHQEKEEPSEFLVMSEIVKTQILGESHHF